MECVFTVQKLAFTSQLTVSAENVLKGTSDNTYVAFEETDFLFAIVCVIVSPNDLVFGASGVNNLLFAEETKMQHFCMCKVTPHSLKYCL